MDAQKIIRDLRASGLTVESIATKVGSKQPTITAYGNGTRGQIRGVPYEVMAALKSLHSRRRHLIPAPPVAAPAKVSHVEQ